MDYVRNSDKIPAHLPKRLTISFPIWGLYDTGTGGKYHDFDKMMVEHKERGFNCIRLDDGAGLIHDRNGNLRGPIPLGQIFGPYEDRLRQFNAFGAPGFCDVHARLIGLFEAAKRHNIYIIMSSWYYLHTLWWVKDRALNAELHAIPPMERFQAFAEFLHYVLVELEERGLDSQIAFAEIFNEADGLRFVNGYAQENGLTDEEIARFRVKHEEAIEWLRKRHPQLLFAYDAYKPDTDIRQLAGNMQVFNFHYYFMWGQLYCNVLENDDSFLIENKISKEELMALADSDYLPDKDWYHRIWYYANLDPAKTAQAAAKISGYLDTHMDEFRDRFRWGMSQVQARIDANLPQVPIVCGEGVTYSGGYALIWEEYSDSYWTLVGEMLKTYREMGLWGSVVRTCCGPEDPCWTLCPERLLKMNRIFLGEE